MMTKENQEIIEYFEQFVDPEGILDIPEQVFIKMEPEYGKLLKQEFQKARLFKLPDFEIKFFKWLKENDPAVWSDLWNTEDEDPYIVSIEFLPRLLEKDGRGFPICDLLSNDNYYFAPEHMVDEESKVMVETAKNMYRENKPISRAQLLALEISFGGIDIWHFAYKHDMKVHDAKKTAQSLIDDNALVHLKDASHLAPLLDF